MREKTQESAPLWTVDALGSRVGVRGLSQAEMLDLDNRWQRCQPGRAVSTNGLAEPLIVRQPDLPWPWQEENLVSQITLAGILGAAGELMMLHAGGVCDPLTGRTLALVAASGTGKTTAVSVLAQHLGYVSDETIAVDPDSLEIRAYPKPLSLLGPGGERPKAQRSPEDLRLLHAHPQPQLHRIASLRRRPGMQGVRIKALSTEEALQELVPQTSALSRLERGVTALTYLLERTGGALRIEYAESAELLESVRGLLRQEVPEELSVRSPGALPERWKPVDFTIDPGQEPGQGRLLRAPAADAVLFDGLLAVLSGEQLHFLSGLGITIWQACSEPHSPEELHALVLEEHGPYPDSEAITNQAIHALLDVGLLRS